MTLREKVILGLAVTAVIGAGLYYASALFSPTAGSSGLVRTDFSNLIAKVQVSLEQGALTDREERVLAVATMQWLRNPLREQPLLTQNSDSSPLVPLPKYIGFLDTGSRLIAIIDGRDYRTGEAIQGGEFQLAHIFPDHIELLRRGATDPVEVPLEQAQFTGGSQ
ncbi:MAG: hypothetical protein ACJAVK_002427 [Akkermansiaceae bacterium]|jgi:hypothetical protein